MVRSIGVRQWQQDFTVCLATSALCSVEMLCSTQTLPYGCWEQAVIVVPVYNHGLFQELQYTLNLLNPTGHVMHQQFNIQQLYALPTLYLFVLYLSENKQRLVPLTA